MVLPWLKTSGRYVIDGVGNEIMLRGSGCDYYAYTGGPPLVAQFLDTLKDRGLNLIRLAFDYDGSHPWKRHTFIDYAKMDQILQLCEERGIYAILTLMHVWGGGAPLPDYKNEWIAKWVEIAGYYKDRSVIAGYELYGEPWAKEALPLYLECINAVRDVDPNHMIFVFEYARTPYEYREALWQKAQGTIATRMMWEADLIQPNMVITTHFPQHISRPDIPSGWQNTVLTGQREAADMIAFMTEVSEAFNCPLLSLEVNMWDAAYSDPTHPDFIMVKDELIRMSERQGFGWAIWMMEKGIDWNSLVPVPYTSPYFTDPLPYDPHPFNLAEDYFGDSYVVDWGRREVWYNRWGPSIYTLPGKAGPAEYVTVNGGATGIQVSRQLYTYPDNILVEETAIVVPSSQNVTMSNLGEGYYTIVRPLSRITGPLHNVSVNGYDDKGTAMPQSTFTIRKLT